MEDTLKRLLDAENSAGDMVRKAQAESERVIEAAVKEAGQQEERFQNRIPELHASFIEKSDQRALQSVAEMERRFDETLAQLREAAEAHEDTALEAAFRTLLGRDVSDLS